MWWCVADEGSVAPGDFSGQSVLLTLCFAKSEPCGAAAASLRSLSAARPDRIGSLANTSRPGSSAHNRVQAVALTALSQHVGPWQPSPWGWMQTATVRAPLQRTGPKQRRSGAATAAAGRRAGSEHLAWGKRSMASSPPRRRRSMAGRPAERPARGNPQGWRIALPVARPLRRPVFLSCFYLKTFLGRANPPWAWVCGALLGHFPGRIHREMGHFPGYWDIFRVESTAMGHV